MSKPHSGAKKPPNPALHRTGHRDFGEISYEDWTGFGTGVYLYRLEAGSFVETRRMVLLK